MRMTRQRQVILEQLDTGRDHLTADQIYERARVTLPRISLGTVYRNLELLTEQGLVRKIGVRGNQRVFEGGKEPHVHMRCLSCQRIEDAPAVVLPDLTHLLKGKTDFEATGYEIEFLGLCPECRAKRKKSSNHKGGL